MICGVRLKTDAWNSHMKESKQITLGSSDSTTAAADFEYSMRGKVISITYLGAGSIHGEIGRILRRIEHWHQGSVKSYRILYQNADGLGRRGQVGRRERGSYRVPVILPSTPARTHAKATLTAHFTHHRGGVPEGASALPYPLLQALRSDSVRSFHSSPRFRTGFSTSS
jgi:hypothetical protein